MSESQSGSSEEVAPEGEPLSGDRARLRLHHLFVLTAVMAVLLAINGPRQNLSGGANEPQQILYTFQLLLGICHTILSSIALTALGYGYAAYRRGEKFFDQPGHWLLAELSLSGLIFMVPGVVYRLSRSAVSGQGVLWSLVITVYMLLFAMAGRTVFNIYLGRTKCTERRWKTVFFMKALGAVLFGLGPLLVIPAVLRASRVDNREHVSRDAGHRCGVVLQVLESTLWLVSVATTVYVMIAASRR